MDPREPVARLDTSVGRGTRVPPPSRNATRTRSTTSVHRDRGGRPRRKPVAAAVLVGVLAGALVVVGHHHSSSAAPLPVDTPDASTTVSAVAAVPDTTALRSLLGPDAACPDRPAAVPSLSCTIGGEHIDAQLVPPASAPARYVLESGAKIAARRGPPSCAKGVADERAWSRPAAPRIAVGRYRCRIEAGKAAIWWFDEHGVVAHAVATDGDLTSLFSWWSSHVDQ